MGHGGYRAGSGRKRKPKASRVKIRFESEVLARIRQAIMDEGKKQISPWVERAVLHYLESGSE